MLKILVIDDAPKMRAMLKASLEQAGYAVITAGDGKEGLKLYSEHNPDLVITDIVMPIKDGIQTISEIRRSNPDARIVALSGGGGGRYSSDECLDLADDAGAEVVILKPVSRKVLLQVIKELIG